MLQLGQHAEVKQFLFSLLLASPGDAEVRSLLQQCVALQPPKDSVKFQQSVVAMVKEVQRSYTEKAAEGWLYACTIDESFIQPECGIELLRREASVAPLIAQTAHGADVSDTLTEAELELSSLLRIDCIEERWRTAMQWVESTDPLLVHDDFFDITEAHLQQALVDSQSGAGLNVVILGGGCVGLSLANALKRSWGSNARILVIESRVHATHVKRPYERQWLTQLGSGIFQGVVDPQVTKIADSFGQYGYLGCTLALLETLLLISCRKMGVKFLFQENYDLSFVEKANTRLVFDATGGRLTEKRSAEIREPAPTAIRRITFPVRKAYGLGFRPFGITHIKDTQELEMALWADGRHIAPAYGDKLVQVPMMKLINIPIALKKELKRQLSAVNHDGIFYCWEGKLKSQINSLMLFVNLDAESLRVLSSTIDSSMSLAEFTLDHASALSALDERVVQVFKMLAEDAAHARRIKLEAPFLYAPSILNEAVPFSKVGNIPLIPIGDSTFKGNPKVGNGLGFHLKTISKINDILMMCY